MTWAHKHKLFTRTDKQYIWRTHTSCYKVSAYMQHSLDNKHDVCTLKGCVLVSQLLKDRRVGCKPG